MWQLPLSLLFLFATLCGYANFWETQSEEEALFLRRISDFWQEGEYQIVKRQIEEFLQLFPQSAFAQTLNATLGDLYLREKNAKNALICYSRIEDPLIAEQVFLNRMQCLFELQWFATLSDECEQFLKKESLEQEKKEQALYLLATSLYQQCLSTDSKELLDRAAFYFKMALDTEFGVELTPAFAHLCCLRNDFSTASQLYLQLAEKADQPKREEMLFQAALLQAKIDPERAIDTFRTIEQLNLSHAEEAIYRRLILMVDAGLDKEVLSEKANLLPRLSSEHQPLARLLFGRSHLRLKEYAFALNELMKGLDAPSLLPEQLRSSLSDLLNASFHAEHEEAFSSALHRLQEAFPNDPLLPQSQLAYVHLLKKNQRFAEARKILESLLASEMDQEQILFELVQLEQQQQHWSLCRTLCRDFLQRFPHSNQLSSIWRFLASSSSHLALLEEQERQQFINDVEELLRKEFFSEQEKNSWRFLLAKRWYDWGYFDLAIQQLDQFLLEDPSFHANAHLLLGLCFRDGKHDLQRFCQEASLALSLDSELLERSAVSIALFNAYFELKEFDRAAEYLFLASQTRSLQQEHLLWLATHYSQEDHKPIERIRSIATLLEQHLSQNIPSVQAFDESHLVLEPVLVKTAELAGLLGQETRQQEILESLFKQRKEHPDWAWMQEDQVDLLLGECYAKMHREEEALALFDAVHAKHPTVRSFAAASAALQSARLQISKWTMQQGPVPHQILAKLKDLVLQKTITNEPIHLEAGFEYVDLLSAKASLNKRLDVLRKTKADFEQKEDLLSQDYHRGRESLPKKDRLYQAYLRLFDAEILLVQSLIKKNDPLKKEALELLQELLKEAWTPFMIQRIERLLKEYS